MKKLPYIIFKKFISLFILLFFVIEIIVYNWIYDFYVDTSKHTLSQEIDLISYQVEKNCNLEELARSVKYELHLHMTLLDSDGNVIIDSHHKKSENLAHKDEFKESSFSSYVYKIRQLEETDKEMLIVSKKYDFGGKYIYIRLSRELEGIKKDILSLNVKIFLVLILFFVALFAISYKIKSEVNNEVDKISQFLKSLTRKTKDNYIHSTYSQEFEYITVLLSKIANIIIKKDKQKEEYTKQLELSNKQKDDIISAISHEFKNPIAVINGYVETLLDDEDIHPNIRKKFLLKIEKSGVKLSHLIDTLRLSMKLDGEHQQLKLHSSNIYKVVVESVNALSMSYPKRDVIIEGDKELCKEIDEGLFGIVISNLIENAFKYSEDEVYVKIDASSITIIDEGIGISSEDLEKITQKFYRVNNNSWNNSLGLGLFLVNNIIKLHNFSLEIESEVNEGSTFKILF